VKIISFAQNRRRVHINLKDEPLAPDLKLLRRVVMTNFNRSPSIRLTRADCKRLERLANASMRCYPHTADYLAHEIERARIVESENASEDLVTMGSSVEFRDNVTGHVRRVVLVYPDKADISDGRISVLTPVGAALIGLSKNQSIDWETPARERRSLTVLSVQQPVAAR
jgi:regulator of nucleoside diphosphate kinase